MFHSIRARLAVWYATVFALFLAFFGAGACDRVSVTEVAGVSLTIVEPLDCAIESKNGACEAWFGSQLQTVDHGAFYSRSAGSR